MGHRADKERCPGSSGRGQQGGAEGGDQAISRPRGGSFWDHRCVPRVRDCLCGVDIDMEARVSECHVTSSSEVSIGSRASYPEVRLSEVGGHAKQEGSPRDDPNGPLVVEIISTPADAGC